ncbi:MAG TPA: hypothetical protein EYG85_04215 [Crocinitomix sp.]|nr:hypothetical protein [Crocinitomix sp.]
MTHIRNLLFITLALSIVACKKEKTTWFTNWNTPLVHGKLTLSDVKKVDINQNSENFASVFFNDTIYSFKVDTLIKLPDTTLIQDAVISFASLTLGPGNLIQNQNIDQLYDLGEIALKRVIVDEGTAIITITTPWQGKSKVVFDFPKTKEGDGSPFTRTYHLPAGSIANPSVNVDTIDMAGFDFDLTGSTGGLVNNILADMYIYSDEETNYITITNQDTVRVVLDFRDMTARYAKGYFGSYSITDTTTLDISQMKQIISGSIALDSINLDLVIQNGFKILTQATFSQFKGINSNTSNIINLTFPQLNSALNINPSTGSLYNHQASLYHIFINSGNSNILAFIENLPDKIDIAFTIDINPYGNINNGADEYYSDSSLDLLLQGDFPLHFSANQLTLVDTMDFSYDANQSATPQSAMITLKYKNKFPLGATAKLSFLDNAKALLNEVETQSQINSGVYNSTTNTTTVTEGEMVFSLNNDLINNLENAKYITLEIALSTDQSSTIKFNIDDYFDFNLFSDLNIKITL